MEIKKAVIIGNSVAIRVRPVKAFPGNNNFGKILENKINEKHPDKAFFVINKSFSRATLYEYLQQLDYLVEDFADYYILNIGIPDVSTRDIPLWFSNWIVRSNNPVIRGLSSRFYDFFIKQRRSLFVKLRGKRSWVSLTNFEKLYKRVIEHIKKESNSKIILMGMNIPSDRIENILPGTRENVLKANEIIKKIGEDYGFEYLTMDNLNVEDHFPDGIHYSAAGHEIVAAQLSSIIEESLNG